VTDPLGFELDGRQVAVVDDGMSLLEALREHLGVRAPKDGCSPQGQCGCCTVLVDGDARVACVTPLRRVAGRKVTTVDGLADADAWAAAFVEAGGSQCGFCTPGIICRLAGLRLKQPGADRAAVDRALAAHLCRCTGWQTIAEAWDAYGRPAVGDPAVGGDLAARDLVGAGRRASIEGGSASPTTPPRPTPWWP
jgi:aerobic-type carbon monoxide dehydrogenase small subunit (CoxS/CutS family)